MKNKTLTIVFIVMSLAVGFYFGRFLASDNVTTNYSCGDITRFHADLLIKQFNINDGFNTDQNNPRRDINQRASDFNARLLADCLADPTIEGVQ